MKNIINDNLDSLTEDILESYLSDERTERIAATFLPSQSSIVDLLTEIRQLIFPGYFGHKHLTTQNIHYHVGNLIMRIAAKLADSICACSSLNDAPNDDDLHKYQQHAQETTHKFLARIPKIRTILTLDAQAAYDGDPAAKSIDEIIYCYPGYFAVTVYRIAHELLRLQVPLMPRIMSEYAHGFTGCDIHPGADIGKSFFIDHATGVVIGETTEIGDNVKIYQGVTLGAKSFPKDERGRAIKGLKRHPTICDNVTIYPNATIIGGETVVGEGVTIGGNAWVEASVEPHHLVVPEETKLNMLDKKNRPK